MKKQYERVVKTLMEIIEEWEPRLDLPGITVRHKFHETTLDPSNPDQTAAVCTTKWEYRTANIDWYLPNLCDQDEQDLEQIVVHEYCHVLNAPVEAHTSAANSKFCEIAAENVARALLKVRHGHD